MLEYYLFGVEHFKAVAVNNFFDVKRVFWRTQDVNLGLSVFEANFSALYKKLLIILILGFTFV
jgi:hypothetical protein